MSKKPRSVGAPARPMKDLTAVGKIMRQIRGELPIDQAAERVGKNRDWWHRREIGTIAVTVDDLEAIAKGFGVRGEWGPTGLTLDTNETKQTMKA